MYQGVEQIDSIEATEGSLRPLEDAVFGRRLVDLAFEKDDPAVLLEQIGELLGYYMQGMFSGMGIGSVDDIYFKLTGVEPNWQMLPHDQYLQRVN